MDANLDRRRPLMGAGGWVTLVAAGCASTLASDDVFDAHCHLIDPRYPIIANQGFTPDAFSLSDYEKQTQPLHITAGAIVSDSFHGYDQSYLRALLPQLGSRWSMRPATY